MSVSYEERKRIADELYAKPPKADQPGQRFPRGARVKIGEMPHHMRHFPGCSEAIVAWTYAQKYWGDDVKNYCLVLLSDGRPVNQVAWYEEGQLTLLSDDTEAGLAIIAAYEAQK